MARWCRYQQEATKLLDRRQTYIYSPYYMNLPAGLGVLEISGYLLQY